MNIFQRMYGFLKDRRKSTSQAERMPYQFPTTRVVDYYDSNEEQWFVPQYKNCFNKWVALSLPIASQAKAERTIDAFLRKSLRDKY